MNSLSSLGSLTLSASSETGHQVKQLNSLNRNYTRSRFIRRKAFKTLVPPSVNDLIESTVYAILACCPFCLNFDPSPTLSSFHLVSAFYYSTLL